MYLDTSALIKLYYPEVESQNVHELVKRENRAILFTSLHELEIKNAFALKVFRREMSDEVYRQLVNTINNDVHTSVLRRVHPNWGIVFRHSLEISGRNTRSIGSRSLDILHVAIALSSGCRRFLTFDDRQACLARQSGLETVANG